jgi:hypothetical protein
MEKNTEIWKDVPTYEGIYQVSNLGNVKSLGNDKTRKEKILKPIKDGKGYDKVNLFKEGNVKKMSVHVLVAMSFLGHIPNGFKIVVDHINGNTLDNNLKNIQLITQRENITKAKRKKRSSKYTGVCWHKIANKFMAGIQIDGKTKYLGLFTDEYEAHLAYIKALEYINSVKNS